MHQDHIAGILFHSHLLDHSGRHGESRNAGSADHGIDLLFQEEVHKSAIGYHRKLRSKALSKSELDDIKGIGEARKAALMKAFKSVDNIKNASIEELSNVVDKKTADAIVEYFKENN